MRKRLLVFVLFFLLGALSLHGVLQTESPPAPWIVSPPLIELTGSNESQLWQNYIADKEGLFRIQNKKQLLFLEKSGVLVRLLQTKIIRIDVRLRKDSEYCYGLPRVSNFLKDCAFEYKHDFPKAFFQINSAVRDEVRQKSIRRTGNQNAADVSGPKASSHLTGATIDITKRKMTKAQIAWWRNKLLELECQRAIEATEEFKQSVFHIMIFASYKRMYFDEPVEKEKVKPGRKHNRRHK